MWDYCWASVAEWDPTLYTRVVIRITALLQFKHCAFLLATGVRMEVLLFPFYLCASISRYMPANTRHSHNIDLLLAHRLRWWTNNKRTWYCCVWSPHVISNLGSDLPPSESRQPYSCHNLTSTRRRLGAGSTSLTLIQRQVDVVSTSGGIWAPPSHFSITALPLQLNPAWRLPVSSLLPSWQLCPRHSHHGMCDCHEQTAWWRWQPAGIWL